MCHWERQQEAKVGVAAFLLQRQVLLLPVLLLVLMRQQLRLPPVSLL
jgi:hypothetical protein